MPGELAAMGIRTEVAISPPNEPSIYGVIAARRLAGSTSFGLRLDLAESALYRVAPVVEDPLEVAADDRPVEKLAERPERERIADAVAHDHVIPVRLEAVDMVPVAVGAAELPVGEEVRRIPVLDQADPPDLNAVQPEAVFDLGPAADRARARSSP
jgi:hypothetical protein